MRCKSCDYSLWGISARACPECGTPFAPSAFRFYPNAVRFLCPHCKQDYYGTTPTGHLDPGEFDCVTCGAHICMDEMVLEPREGVKDERTRPDFNPWLQRKILGTRKAYYRTIGRSIGYPTRLARGTPDDSPTSSALGFFAVHVAFISLFTVVPVAAMMMFAFASVGSAGHRGGGMFLLPMMVLLGLPTIGFFGVLFLSALLTQLGLLLLAARPMRLSATVKAIAYASAPLLLLAVPCFGFQLAIFAIPWWMINAIVMVAAFHRIAWWRAAIAHVIAASIVVGAPFGLLAFGMYQSYSSAVAHTSPASLAGFQLNLALTSHSLTGATAPTHLLDLMPPGHQLFPIAEDLTRNTITPPDILIAGRTLDAHMGLPPSIADPINADLRAAMLPSGVHRISHLVLCYHGVDVVNPQSPDLWIAVIWPDPDSTAAFTPAQTVTVILASGMAQDIPLAQFPSDLAAQNAARKSLGIPEIPDPATVHMWPPGSQYGPSPSPTPAPVP